MFRPSRHRHESPHPDTAGQLAQCGHAPVRIPGEQLRLDFMVPLHPKVGVGVAGEYFDRRTYYKDVANDTRKFHFPQIRAFLTWRMS